MIDDLRFFALTLCHEFCRYMEMLPADVHRIAAVKLYFLSSIATCMAQLTPYAIPIFLGGLFTFFEFPIFCSIKKSSIFWQCRASTLLLPNAVFFLLLSVFDKFDRTSGHMYSSLDVACIFATYILEMEHDSVS